MGQTPAVYSLICVMCLWFTCGCTMFNWGDKFDLSQRIPWMTNAIVKQPTRMTTLWTHTVLNQPGRKGVRGFGGRIMFHGKETDKPVRVEGTLTIYAFDETDRAKSVPERKFVFTPEQFETHYSKSKLGHSYSIWLPWDEVGGESRRINLLARFEPAEGSMIMSEQSLQSLPGISPDEYDPEGGNPPEKLEGVVQQVSFQDVPRSASSKEALTNRKTIEADTIDLPPNFSRRLGLQEVQPPARLDVDEQKSNVPDIQQLRKLRDEANNTEGKDAATDSSETSSSSPFRTMMERRKELSNHFERRRSLAQRASSVQSADVAPQTGQPPAKGQSGRQTSQSPELTNPFETDLIPAESNSR